MLANVKDRELKRVARHKRIRKRIGGTGAQPRLCIYRSLKNIGVQLVDDIQGKVLMGMSTLDKELRAKLKAGGDVKAAALLGEVFAERILKKGIKKISFDRGGYLYHGRIKAFAEGARKAGLEF